ncbi:restriction endonuclease subunit S [Citrobacter freundii]|uniref:restriction endonuclease subunit S n=1 Tax=Citrobacter freundii TaxID=546 RepID=UPI0015A7B6A8|nr:restriction endonuclease subunit S [Citrobacter freundii]MDV1856300.1 restriction endonuclease subunit S [Citrobacter freundii]MEB0417494.1 restriction endonuclease subunit S [Citrobacter freundii]MEB0915099.1 restriction endonuclease subunit S [Citrobacter freundii]QLD09061.1 restriction endonuclease subunit S [Citrobacter freundii]
MSAGKLPEGWVDTQLGSIIELKYGKSLAAQIRDGFGFPVYGSNGVVGKHSIPLINKSGLIVGRKGSYGVVNKSIGPFFPIDTTYYIDDFYNQPLEFLFYYLSFLPLTKLNRSTAIPGLNRDDAYDLNIALPPLAEQKIIAEKLDTLLAQVDSTKARLEQIPQILKRFRQAILTAAISGRLTDKWRKLTDLQTIWKSHTLGELVTIDRGSSPRPIKDYITTDENGVNWIKIGDTKEGEKYIRSTKERITREGSKKSRKVTPGDFILSNSMSLGRAYIVEIEGYVHDGWFILRLPENIDKDYFYYLLSSSQLQTQFSSLAVGGVVQNIRSELVKQAIVNIPPLPEQHEIVRRVEQLFAYADTIEKQVNNALSRVNSLTQSILAKAFRGELTAQWRAENPDLTSGENSAAALLEKIKAERAASGGKKASRKKA